MRIFIDESGTFLPNAAKEYAFSVVGAVIVPGRFWAKVEKGFLELSRDWPREKGELKGRLLQEQHIAALCKFLEPFHVIFEVTAIDLNMVSKEEVEDFQGRQGEKITENLTDEYAKAVRDKLWELRNTLGKMPPQLYLQSVALTQLMWRAFTHATLYHCQRFPGELAKFSWTIDAKDRTPTRSELWWKDALMPFLQSISMREPFYQLQGGDYSAFHRNFPLRPAPGHLKPRMQNPNRPVGNLKGIFGKAITFEQSHTSVGLQIADILTNAIRRALSGHLNVLGWHPIGRLMINHRAGAIQFIAVGGADHGEDKFVSAKLAKIARGRRTMVADERPARKGTSAGRK